MCIPARSCPLRRRSRCRSWKSIRPSGASRSAWSRPKATRGKPSPQSNRRERWLKGKSRTSRSSACSSGLKAMSTAWCIFPISTGRDREKRWSRNTRKAMWWKPRCSMWTWRRSASASASSSWPAAPRRRSRPPASRRATRSPARW